MSDYSKTNLKKTMILLLKTEENENDVERLKQQANEASRAERSAILSADDAIKMAMDIIEQAKEISHGLVRKQLKQP